MYKPYKHKHVYVYKFLMKQHKFYGNRYKSCSYTLCTDITGPNCKENRRLLETGLRLAYNHYPKTIKFSYEKHD